MKKHQKVFVYLGLFVAFAIASYAFWPFDKSPDHKMIDIGFYICDKCQSAEGGIFGKGPFKQFRTDNASWCIHNWRKVDKKEFKEYTFCFHNYDWSNEIPFWNNE